MNGVIRKDANNHIIPGLYGFLASKSVTYATEAVSAQATLSTALTGNNNDLDFTAVPYGALGNNISIVYVDPGGATATLSVVVTQPTDSTYLITVNLGRAASAINTTGDLLKTAWDASDAVDYVTVADKAANDGSGLVIAMAETPLAGGAGRTLFTVTGDVIIRQFSIIGASDFSGSGALQLGSETVVDLYHGETSVSSLDAKEAWIASNVSKGQSLLSGTFTPNPTDEDIRDKITTNTITGSLTYYVFWYPISDDGNVVATSE